MPLLEHLEKLRHFTNSAQFRSISEAARSQKISQAGLSKSIALLEDVLGTTLLNRHPGGFSLTAEGALTAKAGKEISLIARRLENALRSRTPLSLPTRLRIGMYDSISVYMLKDFSDYMQQIYPQVKLELVADASAQLRKQVQERTLSIAVGIGLDVPEHESAKYFHLYDDRYGFYVSSRVVGKDAELDWIIHPTATDGAGKSMEEALKKILRGKVVHHVYNFETLKTLTRQGHGIGVLPTRVASPLVLVSILQPYQPNAFPASFGPHRIGFLAAKPFLKRYEGFAEDLFRFVGQWLQTH